MKIRTPNMGLIEVPEEVGKLYRIYVNRKRVEFSIMADHKYSAHISGLVLSLDGQSIVGITFHDVEEAAR